MAVIKAKAYIPGAREQDLLFGRYPAFASADVSEKAKEQDVYRDYSNKGVYYLRTTLPWKSSTPVDFVSSDGSHLIDMSLNYVPGLRVGLSLNYIPQSEIVSNCKKIKRTAWVYNETAGEDITKLSKKETSKAPVVTYGGIEYIWLNKKECEKGESAVMQLISVDILCKAEPFTAKGNKSDYATAVDLRAQCEKVAFENATEEEKAMVAEVIMSSNDGYKTMVYTNLAFASDFVKNLFDKFIEGEITAQEWKEKMFCQLKEMENDESFTNEDIMEFGDSIYSTYEIIKDKKKIEESYIENE